MLADATQHDTQVAQPPQTREPEQQQSVGSRDEASESQNAKLAQLSKQVAALSENVMMLIGMVKVHGAKLDAQSETLDVHGAKLDAQSETLKEHGAILHEHGSKLDAVLQHTSVGNAAQPLGKYLCRLHANAAIDGAKATYTGVQFGRDGVRYIVTALHAFVFIKPAAQKDERTLVFAIPDRIAQHVDGVGFPSEWLTAEGWAPDVDSRGSDLIMLRLRDGGAGNFQGMPSEFVDLSSERTEPKCLADIVGLTEGGIAVTGRLGDAHAMLTCGAIPMAEIEGCVVGSSGTLMFPFTSEGVATSAPIGLYVWGNGLKRGTLAPVPKPAAAAPANGALASVLASGADGNAPMRFALLRRLYRILVTDGKSSKEIFDANGLAVVGVDVETGEAADRFLTRFNALVSEGNGMGMGSMGSPRSRLRSLPGNYVECAPRSPRDKTTAQIQQ